MAVSSQVGYFFDDSGRVLLTRRSCRLSVIIYLGTFRRPRNLFLPELTRVNEIPRRRREFVIITRTIWDGFQRWDVRCKLVFKFLVTDLSFLKRFDNVRRRPFSQFARRLPHIPGGKVGCLLGFPEAIPGGIPGLRTCIGT